VNFYLVGNVFKVFLLISSWSFVKEIVWFPFLIS
jgi:hypothetical protein